ncbi:hypothetical protein GCM10018789_33710 [Streptomyces werraensis]|nr:hypothetical protein GCM10018789_33710 [Streptomyces werraensis]
MTLPSPASGDGSPAAVATRLTGRAVTRVRPLSGALAEAALDDGRTVVVKAPLAGGWRERVGVHQLFPLLVHAVLFGRGYAGQVLGVARSALAL